MSAGSYLIATSRCLLWCGMTAASGEEPAGHCQNRRRSHRLQSAWHAAQVAVVCGPALADISPARFAGVSGVARSLAAALACRVVRAFAEGWLREVLLAQTRRT